MAKQKGREVLVKIGDGESPEVFTTIFGMTTAGLTINNNSYANTTPDQTTPGGQLHQSLRTGVRSMQISGSGIFEDDAAYTALLNVAVGTGVSDLTDAVANFQLIVPDLGTFEGSFHVTELQNEGEMEGDVTYSVTLDSAGVITFTAA